MLIKRTIIFPLLMLTSLAFSKDIVLGQAQQPTKNAKTSSKKINNYYKNGQQSTDQSLQSTDLIKSASIKAKNNDFAGAKADLEKAIAANPNDANAHLNYALLIVNNFSNLAAAKKHFEAAINIAPDFAKAHYLYAVVLKIFYKDNTNARKQYLLASKLKASYITADADKLFGIKR